MPEGARAKEPKSPKVEDSKSGKVAELGLKSQSRAPETVVRFETLQGEVTEVETPKPPRSRYLGGVCYG